jgi:antitoxin ParD1/3/4
MATITMNISLPDTMREYVEERTAKDGYSTVSEYVRELIRADQKRKAEEQLEALLLEGIRSGEATPLTKQDIEEAKRVVKERIKARQKK